MKPPAPARAGIAPVLITGGAGFIGSNLADRLAREGEHVLLLDALAREGVARNVAWLKARHPQRVSFVLADIRDEDSVVAAAREACAVFHFAAQVAVTTSLADPRADFAVNAGGTLGLLDALRRHGPRTPLIFASTNKVYGDLAGLDLVNADGACAPADEAIRRHGVSELQPLDFHTPYGCSKGAAEQYVLDYARTFGLPTAVMRMSCIYGPRQMGTEDQGWVAHFLLRLLAGAPITLFGDGRQVRDILYVDDAVEAYVRAWRRIRAVSGCAFNLGGGPANAVSLLNVIAQAEQMLGTRADLVFQPARPGDQRYYVSDTRRAMRALDLPPPVGWRAGIGRLAGWLRAEADGMARAAPSAEPVEA